MYAREMISCDCAKLIRVMKKACEVPGHFIRRLSALSVMSREFDGVCGINKHRECCTENESLQRVLSSVIACSRFLWDHWPLMVSSRTRRSWYLIQGWVTATWRNGLDQGLSHGNLTMILIKSWVTATWDNDTYQELSHGDLKQQESLRGTGNIRMNRFSRNEGGK